MSNEQAEERTCATCKRRLTAHVHAAECEHFGMGCIGMADHHPFTPAPSDEPKPDTVGERVSVPCYGATIPHEWRIIGNEIRCVKHVTPPNVPLADLTYTFLTAGAAEPKDAAKDEPPKEVKSVGRRISELRQVSRQVSMDASATKRQLEKLHEHADELYYEFAAIMRQMGWKR